MMNTTFEIDGIAYHVAYEDHRFLFTNDSSGSSRSMAEYDPSGACHDKTPERPSLRSSGTATGSILRVKREVMTFIDQALCEYRPYYFTFSANEYVKISLYRRIARRVARTHGFTLYVSPEHAGQRWERFSFYYQVAVRGTTGPEIS